MMGEENIRYPRFFSSHESEETRDYLRHGAVLLLWARLPKKQRHAIYHNRKEGQAQKFVPLSKIQARDANL
jgi:hypothetical protein